MATTMMDPLPSCFRGGGRRATSSSSATPTPPGPALTTTVYENQHGLAALTWSRTMLGLSLRVDLRLPSCASFSAAVVNDASSSASAVSSAESSACYSFRVRPWLLWKRRGTKRFRFKDPSNQGHHRAVDLAWDLSRAAFPSAGGPEPTSGFFVAVSVDGEMLLSIGDLHEISYKKMKTKNNAADDRVAMVSPQNPILLARREHVVVLAHGSGRLQPPPQPQSPSSSCTYSTRAHVGGKEREIAIDLGGRAEKDLRLRVLIDGRRVLQVRRLRWKFRGGELVEVEGCDAKVHISWDVHRWLFPAEPKDSPLAYSSAVDDLGHGVVVFRFNREGHFPRRKRPIFCNGGGGSICGANGGGDLWGLAGFGRFGNSDRSTSSSIGGGGGSGRWRRRSGLLAKTRSSSSSSSASSGSSSSVSEWASTEENELKESEGFSLVVSFWKL